MIPYSFSDESLGRRDKVKSLATGELFIARNIEVSS
jgi:hypothetical protein